MECPDFPQAEELKEDLEKYEAMWGLFEEFNTGLQNLAQEDWISFRFEYMHYFDISSRQVFYSSMQF